MHRRHLGSGVHQCARQCRQRDQNEYLRGGCHARLKLYESLDTLQQQVLYYDTDSVVYKWQPGQPSIAIGDFLGDMTDELDGDVITEFVSGDAKNYGYTTRGGKVVCKVRGFTLNVRGSAILNFHTMKENILSELDSPREARRTLNITTPYYFKRDLEKKQIQVVPRVKQFFFLLYFGGPRGAVRCPKAMKTKGTKRSDKKKNKKLG